jgi:uncharacterized membrane protein
LDGLTSYAHPRPGHSSRQAGSERSAAVATTVAVLLALGAGGLLSASPLVVHLSFGFGAYDVGMHLQALWKLAHLRGLFNTIRGLAYWGDHLWIAYGLLAPIYRVWESPAVVYAYQGFGLAAGGLVVYGLARRRLESGAAALVPAILYWGYPGVLYTANDNFHPEAIASTWLLAMLWADAAGRPRLYWAAVVLALLTKEDVALYLVGFAAYAFVAGERRRAIVLACLSAAYFALAMKVLLPWLNGVGFFRTTGGYWFSTWAANASRPAFYLEVARRPVTSRYLWDLLWPVAFLPLGRPLTLVLLAGPAFVVNTLGGAYLVNVRYHYLYGILPGLFAATVETLATLERFGRRWIAWTGLRRALAVLVFGLVLVPTLRHQWATRGTTESYLGMARHLRPYDSEKVRRMRELLAAVPSEAVVSASYDLVPFLANRDAVLMFPNPWRTTYWGIDGENPMPTDRVDVLLLDRAVNRELADLVRSIMSDGWDVVADDHELLYARRRRP